jgi:hypothetical protein
LLLIAVRSVFSRSVSYEHRLDGFVIVEALNCDDIYNIEFSSNSVPLFFYANFPLSLLLSPFADSLSLFPSAAVLLSHFASFDLPFLSLVPTLLLIFQ